LWHVSGLGKEEEIAHFKFNMFAASLITLWGLKLNCVNADFVNLQAAATVYQGIIFFFIRHSDENKILNIVC
jgi:hypothetical protein